MEGYMVGEEGEGFVLSSRFEGGGRVRDFYVWNGAET